jgi:hypothetical protein
MVPNHDIGHGWESRETANCPIAAQDMADLVSNTPASATRMEWLR